MQDSVLADVVAHSVDHTGLGRLQGFHFFLMLPFRVRLDGGPSNWSVHAVRSCRRFLSCAILELGLQDFTTTFGRLFGGDAKARLPRSKPIPNEHVESAHHAKSTTVTSTKHNSTSITSSSLRAEAFLKQDKPTCINEAASAGLRLSHAHGATYKCLLGGLENFIWGSIMLAWADVLGKA